MATRTKAAPATTRATRAPAKKAATSRARATDASTDNSRWADVALPAGFVPVTNEEFGEDWDFENDPVLVGTVAGDVRVVESGKGKAARTARVVSITDEATGVIYNVWESASLHTWFDAISKGQRVAIMFKGYKDVNKGSPMKLFYGSIEPPAEGTTDKPAAKRARR